MIGFSMTTWLILARPRIAQVLSPPPFLTSSRQHLHDFTPDRIGGFKWSSQHLEMQVVSDGSGWCVRWVGDFFLLPCQALFHPVDQSPAEQKLHLPRRHAVTHLKLVLARDVFDH